MTSPYEPPPGWQPPPPPPPPPAPMQPPPPAGYYGGPPPMQQSTNGFAIASLVLGILWIYWIGSILALVFGYMAKKQIDESNGTQGGRGLAIAGIVLAWIGVAFLVLFILLAVAVRGSQG